MESTEVTTIDTTNYAAMAKMSGIANEAKGEKKSSSNLARLRVSHTPIMGETQINGKVVKAEVVSGGTYKLEIPNGPTYYGSSVEIRPYIQRFMYKRFLRGVGDAPNRYIKTVMADDINIDLKDNDGGFNCGKPAGWIEDYKNLPESTKDLLKTIKRTRVVFGTVKLVDPVDENGESVVVPDDTPFIWEIDNRDAYKNVGMVFNKLAKMQLVPIQHVFTSSTEARTIPTGAVFYVPVTNLNITKKLDITKDNNAMFADFLGWVSNYNKYILGEWDEKQHLKKEDAPFDASEIVDIEVELESA
ncbi:MAG: hypothetical protein VW739_01385 [Pelagibacteraceae bacterium]